MPYLTGANTGKPHEALYWRFGPQWAVRKADYKLVASNIDGVGKELLYNLKDDIGETKDLSAAMPEKVRELKADWEKWSAEQEKPRWVPQPAKKKKKDKKDDDQ
jgi:arylsulfatase A-like enzyme